MYVSPWSPIILQYRHTFCQFGWMTLYQISISLEVRKQDKTFVGRMSMIWIGILFTNSLTTFIRRSCLFLGEWTSDPTASRIVGSDGRDQPEAGAYRWKRFYFPRWDFARRIASRCCQKQGLFYRRGIAALVIAYHASQDLTISRYRICILTGNIHYSFDSKEEKKHRLPVDLF